MKIFSFFFFVLSICLFTSCGSDDSVEGKWTLVSFSYTDCVDPDDNEVEAGYSATACTEQSSDDCFHQEFDFLSNGTLQITATDNFGGSVDVDTNSGTYTVDGDMITICEGGDCENGTYSISGDVLTLTLDDIDECSLVVRMTKS